MNVNCSQPGNSNELEQQLVALGPRPAAIDRDQLMFQAGRAEALSELTLRESPSHRRTRSWLWPSAAGLMTAAAAVLAVILIVGPESEVQVQTVYVDRPTAMGAVSSSVAQPAPGAEAQPGPRPPAAAAPGSAPRSWVARQSRGLIHARDMALAFGVDSLPTGMSSRGQAADEREQSVASLRAEISVRSMPAAADKSGELKYSSDDWLPQVLAWPLGM